MPDCALIIIRRIKRLRIQPLLCTIIFVQLANLFFQLIIMLLTITTPERLQLPINPLNLKLLLLSPPTIPFHSFILVLIPHVIYTPFWVFAVNILHVEAVIIVLVLIIGSLWLVDVDIIMGLLIGLEWIVG